MPKKSCLVAATFCLPFAAAAFTVAIAPGTKSIYLRVGAGSFILTNYQNGGSGADQSLINDVQVTVPSTSLGQGPRSMTVSNPLRASFYDSTEICSAQQIYIGGYYRGAAGSASADLFVTSPANLLTGSSNALSFGSISWTVTTRAGFTPDIANGSFVPGTTQFLRAVPGNTYFEDCLSFSYANSSPLTRAGQYSGQVTYTLVVP